MKNTDVSFFTDDRLNNLEIELYKLYRQYFVQNKRPKMVYHYTSTIDNLFNILCKRKLYLSEATTMVDKNELNHGLTKILSLLNKSINLNNKSWRLFYNRFESFFHNEVNIYISSFCLYCDYHCAWTEYANDGQGFCIGFDSSYSNCCDKFHKNEIGLLEEGKVIYNFDDCLEYVEKVIAKVNQEFQLNDENLFRGIGTLTTAYLLPIIPLHKSEHQYSREKEYRMFQFEDKTGLISSNYREWKITADRKINRIKDGVMIPTIYSPKFKQDTVKEIYIGPNCLDKDNVESRLENILNRYQFSKVRIIRSGVNVH